MIADSGDVLHLRIIVCKQGEVTGSPLIHLLRGLIVLEIGTIGMYHVLVV